ncbi:hypothetical protein ZOSMA_5G00580 [Zostera marina]|uniref:RING-type domain-containing protein n=1 Tax=Zostera marina TaxID=29655 RepID=A0A0K9NW66_ZOSMR|nr:hypothetical protein ZOSMA_5G00580 [Zostera marina]
MQTFREPHVGYIVNVVIFLAIFFSFIFYCYFCSNHRNRQTPNIDPEFQMGHVRIHILIAEDEPWRSRRLVLGLRNEVIECCCPKFPYSSSTQFDEQDGACCSICLGEYEEREMLRLLPECGHRFHLVCVDQWLNINGSCPVCRTFAVKKQAAVTPLQPPMQSPF